MLSVRRLAVLLALAVFAAHAALSQSASNSSAAPQSSSSQASGQEQNQAQQPALTPQQLSVQERIRQRRLQRRAQAIHDTYSQHYESYLGMGYLRFSPGPHLQRLTYYAWDAGIARYQTERFGITVDGRGYNGMAYVGPNQFNITRLKVSTYAVMAGPTYRFYLQPRFSISGRALAGWALGSFSGSSNSIGSTAFGIWHDSSTFAIDAGAFGDLNVSPNFALRLGPEYFVTGFGSTTQNSIGFSGGFVYRFGKR